ncbi:MAG: acetylxylan esterase, partial [Thermoguttaceae bacterium]|nr:acetylxylan esterase [Thermoguttaceae bacterium]
QLEPLLAETIVGTTLPLAEVQRYCEARVPVMPACQSAEEWQREASRLRQAILERVVYAGEAAAWRDLTTAVEWLDEIEGGPGYRIRRLRFEVVPGMWTAGLLYEPLELSGKVPAILNVNGHTSLGKQYPAKQIRCINQAKRGMLALNVEWLGMGQLGGDDFNHARMNQLDLCGTSGLAPFYLLLKRSLDILLELDHADPERVAVTGLSGGGWQTITISALDTRVKLSNPVAGYSSFLTRSQHLKDLGDSEQAPCDLATLVDYTHLTAMLAPRPALLTYNSKDDCCFESGYALPPLIEAATPVYRLFGHEDRLRSHVNDDPGTHNFERENREALYKMLGDFFYPGQPFDPREIASDSEVKTADQLAVPLPEPNAGFNSLARALCQPLPRSPALPQEVEAARQWQQERRQRLLDITRFKPCQAAAVEHGSRAAADLEVTFWKLLMGGSWTIPAVEFVSGSPQQTALLVADGGRKTAAADAARLLAQGWRVIAIDPTSIGESNPGNDLYALLVSAAGDRPLAIEAAQLAAAARWSRQVHPSHPVTLVARGPRSSGVALVTAAFESEAIDRVELFDSLGSLKETIENNWPVSRAPELFCFGLLEQFDLRHLVALIAPRPVVFHEPGDRAKAELAGAPAWYRLLGSEHDPLAAP